MNLRKLRESPFYSGSNRPKQAAVMMIALSFVATYFQPMAISADESSLRSGTGIAKADDTTGTKERNRTVGDNLSLDNIQDVAFTLQRIRQQAINIYVEATRKKVYRFQLNVPSMSSMPSAALEDQSAYLPLRKAWIAFFIGTMEPLVQILNDNVKTLDDRTEHSNMPSQFHPEWEEIVKEWKTAIHGLNAQLDVCANLLDDTTPGNLEAAKSAKAIDDQISALDTILLKASKFLHDKIPAS